MASPVLVTPARPNPGRPREESPGLRSARPGKNMTFFGVSVKETLMNALKLDKQIAILSALVEGNSIRSTERMTQIHRDTIMRLLQRIGEHCQRLMDHHLYGFQSQYIQVDEIWTFVQKKQAQLTEAERENSTLGDQYVVVAIDAETKLIPTFVVGKRTGQTALQFLIALQKQLAQGGRIQLTTDGLLAYRDAVDLTFGSHVDYAQAVKVYASVDAGDGRYSPPRVSEVVKTVIMGNPAPEHISTSSVERQNLTMRMAMRRFTRLTNAFSKKLANLKAALALHFAHYNFVRLHRTLRVTPAMEAGITNHVWGWEELVVSSP